MSDARQSRLRPLARTPTVTVITVCKDRAWCIEECVRSVLAQDYPNIEYLVQDGASRDRTLEVLKKYEGRVQIHSEPDRGPMDAFHKALAKATGDIFCMLLSDERFHDDGVVSRIVEAFRSYPDSGAIYGDYLTVDAHYRTIGLQKKRQMTFEEIFCQDDFISPCAAFVRTDTLKENGRLRSDLRSFFDVIGDYGLWLCVGSRYPLKYAPGIIADFMIHGGAISYGLQHCQAYIRECETAIASFHSDLYSPDHLAVLKKRALARLYLNYSNLLAGKHFSESIRLAWKGITFRPRLIFTKAFLSVVIKAAGLSWLRPVGTDGTRMKGSVPQGKAG